ncbi:hypothetical protein GWK47_002845 [Chionoecetes opilio]|uniref:Uncharacterized protein n=1 Tax=Chionoecetes opilio TaxID=41210 RepID=A0A8J4XLX5_CHIOP|nr:hypothetical protein GWK47_002845 [Chionoecetes opilio]
MRIPHTLLLWAERGKLPKRGRSPISPTFWPRRRKKNPLAHLMLECPMVLLWYPSSPVTGITTFDDYASGVFVPHIMRQRETSMRVDVVWDRYLDNSNQRINQRETGERLRRKVAGQTKVPGNWPDFLRDPTNKVELFQFLSEKIVSIPSQTESRSLQHRSLCSLHLALTTRCRHVTTKRQTQELWSIYKMP